MRRCGPNATPSTTAFAPARRASAAKRVVDRSDDVRDVRERDELRALAEHRAEALDRERVPVAIDLPLSDRRARIGEADPRAAVCLVIELGHHDLVASSHVRSERLREHGEVRGRGRAQNDVRRGRAEERRRRVLARLDALGRADRAWVGGAALRAADS
jgi:hypothetical protein